jgi:hypothetical protein
MADMTNDKLWEVITNAVADCDCSCLDDAGDRAAVRDHLYSTLVQTFDIRNTRVAD